MSESSAPLNSCPQCGSSLSSDATAALCPRCILAQAMQPDSAAAEDPSGLDVTVCVAAPVSSGTARQEVDLPLPEELTQLLPHGNYSVESFLGQGGMGAVYRGTQIRLKRPVAIKIMRRAMGRDYDFEQRFEREAQAMAKLNHPNIVSVIDYGEAGPDYLYIVMELIDGADMMDVIRGGQMTQEMALSLLPQICDALQFAHEHGIVHRDIKPSNIMLTRDGRIKMADFGLAKHFDAENSFRTQTGTGMGTPDYAAPEQFSPDSPIDHRADIYALGVMIYQMITGQLPRGAWKRPSERAAVSPQWDTIVSRAMQSDPSDRYQHASEVKTDVSSIPLAGTGRAAGPSAAASSSASAMSPNTALGSQGTPPKSKTPFLFGVIGAAAVVAVLAFVALHKPEQGSPAPPSATAGGLDTTPAAEPGALRLWDTPEKIPHSEGVSWQGDMISLRKASLKGAPLSRDAILRASIRADSVGVVLALRFRSDENARYFRLTLEANKRISLRDGTAAPTLISWALPRDYSPEEWIRFEFRVAGDEASVVVDGKPLGTFRNSSAPGPGQPMIYGSGQCYFRDIVYLPLDESAPSSSLASAPLSALPESGWQPLFTDSDWRSSQPGTREYQNGLVHLTEALYRRAQTSPDGGIRTRIRFQADSAVPGIVFRLDSAGSGYKFVIAENGTSVGLNRVKEKKEFQTLSNHRLKTPLKPGDTITLELHSQGSHLVALVDGAPVIDVHDNDLQDAGEWGVAAGNGWFESVEVQTLKEAILSKSPIARSPIISIPGLPDLPPLTIPPGEPGLVKEIPLLGSLIRKVALLPDSRRIIVVRDQFTDLIDLETGSSIWTTDGGIAASGALTPDGTKFVDYRILTPDGRDFGGAGEYTHAKITLRETAGGRVLQTWKVPASKMSSSSEQVALSPSGQIIVARVASVDTKEQRSTRFVALKLGQEHPLAEWNVAGHAGHSTHCLDEDSFLSTGAGAPVFLKPSKPEEQIQVTAPFAKAFYGSTLSPQKKWLVASEDLFVKVWDMKQKQPLMPLHERPKGGFDRGAFAGEETVVNIGTDQMMTVWSTTTGRLLVRHLQPRADQQFSYSSTGASNGQFFVATTKPGPSAPAAGSYYLQIFSLPKPGQPTPSPNRPQGQTAALSSPSPEPANSPSPTTSIPGLPDLPPLTIPPGEPGLVKQWNTGGTFLRSFEILPDNRRLLIFQDGTTTLRDMENEVSVWSKPSGIPKSTACSRDGSRFADCSFEQEDGKAVDGPVKAHHGKITLHVTATGETIQTWTFPSAPISVPGNRIAISDDGRTIVAGVAGLGYGKGDSIFLAFQEGKQEPIAQWRDAQHNGHATICLGGNLFLSTGNQQPLLLDVDAPGKTNSPFEGLPHLRSDISPDRRWLVAAENTFSSVWDMSTHKRIRPLLDSPANLAETSFAGNDLVVALSPSLGTGTIQQRFMGVWDRNDGRLLARLKEDKTNEYFEIIRCANNGSFCLTKVRCQPSLPGGETNLLQIWRLPKPGQVHSSATAIPGGATAVSPSAR